jgi:hypothetical protein
MIYVQRQMDVPTEVGEGDELPVSGYQLKTVQFHGEFVATMRLQARIGDSGDWTDVSDDVTAPRFVPVSDSWQTLAGTSQWGGNELAVAFIRIAVTSYTSGRPRADFAGVRLEALASGSGH